MQTRINAQLFSPASPAHGEVVQVWCDGSGIWVDGKGVCLPVAELKPRYGGFNREQVFFDWKDPQGEAWSVSTAAADAETLMLHAPPTLAEPFRQAQQVQQKRMRRSHIGLGMLAVYILLPFIILLVLLWKSHQIAEWVASFIPLEQEEQLGEMFFQEATAGMKLRQEGQDYQVLKAIGERLTQGSAYTYRWYIADSPEVNAFAVPGGYVVANTALLKLADSAEELAGVIAHEVQHVEQRHTLENLIYDLGWQASLALMVGDVSSLWVTQAVTDLGGLKFSRDLESEADMKGLDALHKAGIAPQGMVTFFEKLAAEQGMDVPAFLSTHPSSEKRGEILQDAIQQREGWASQRLPYDWQSLKAGIPAVE